MNLIILDRDGVINFDSDEYIKSPEEWVPVPGSLEAIAHLTRAGYTVIVASNQSGVGRGLFDLPTLQRIHDKMQQEVAQAGGTIAAIFFCPHTPDDHCDCRKPKPGLFRQIVQHFHCDLRGVYAVGDSLRDVEAARAVGASPILVRTGKGSRIAHQDMPENVPVYDNLAAFVDAVLTVPKPC